MLIMSKTPSEGLVSLDALLRASGFRTREDLARAIDQGLVHLARIREHHDLALGRAAAAMKAKEGWRDLGFATWTEFCDDLGMEVGHVERLIARARKIDRRLRSADVRAEKGGLPDAATPSTSPP